MAASSDLRHPLHPLLEPFAEQQISQAALALQPIRQNSLAAILRERDRPAGTKSLATAPLHSVTARN
jgi:hypothetical protein